jgi:bla regulator protein BlaR1
MLSEMTNHLWQSTLFGIVLGTMTIAFRNNHAHVRYWMWLSASIKFLLPFALLIGLGRHLALNRKTQPVTAPSVIAFSLVQLSEPFHNGQPFTNPVPDADSWVARWILGLWAGGFATIVLIRARGWKSIRAVVRHSTPLDSASDIQVRSSHSLVEPGVVGFFRPVLLLPAGIEERLGPALLQAVLAHEFCHARRRDNLTSAIHMVVEAVLWFHPLVWWIGARLVEERERACDEAVLTLGNDPHDYAEGILNVCRSYMEAPLSCVTGVTGADLERRIQAILQGCVTFDLTFAKKLMLAGAGLTAFSVPIIVGITSVPRIQAQSQLATPNFEVVSIRTCSAFRKDTVQDWSPGTLHTECTTVERLIQQAYGLFGDGHMNPASALTVTGGPAWTTSDLYEIDATAHGPEPHSTMNGPILRAILDERFKLKLHSETREVAEYAVRVADGGRKLQPFVGTCTPRDFNNQPSTTDCGTMQGYAKGFRLEAGTIADLCAGFSVLLNRHVIDETGLERRFNMRLDLSADDRELVARPRALPAVSDPTVPAPPPVSFSGAKNAMALLGLNLGPSKGPGEFLIIDEVERPSRN